MALLSLGQKYSSCVFPNNIATCQNELNYEGALQTQAVYNLCIDSIAEAWREIGAAANKVWNSFKVDAMLPE